MAPWTAAWRYRWLVAVLAILRSATAYDPAPLQPAACDIQTALQGIVSEVLANHCSSAEQESAQEQRIIESTKKALAELFAETFPKPSGRPEPDPRWRCSCPSGFIPCGGRCYARLQTPVEYAEAERQCTLLGGYLAVPRSREQSLCVAGLAGYEHVWLGITDREEEGVFMGADGRPVTDNEGQVWSLGQPDNAGGVEHCVSSWKVRGGDSPVRFGEWNDYPCTGLKIRPMCQLP